MYILSGKGVAVLGSPPHTKEQPVAPGDFLGFRRHGPAHKFVNTDKAEDLVFLVVGERSDLDVCTYPEANKQLVIMRHKGGKSAASGPICTAFFSHFLDRPLHLDASNVLQGSRRQRSMMMSGRRTAQPRLCERAKSMRWTIASDYREFIKSVWLYASVFLSTAGSRTLSQVLKMTSVPVLYKHSVCIGYVSTRHAAQHSMEGHD